MDIFGQRLTVRGGIADTPREHATGIATDIFAFSILIPIRILTSGRDKAHGIHAQRSGERHNGRQHIRMRIRGVGKARQGVTNLYERWRTHDFCTHVVGKTETLVDKFHLPLV